MKKILATSTIILAATGLFSPVSGQDAFGVELRANGAISTQDTEREYNENGFGFEANLQYQFHQNLSAYAGWDWARFSALNSIAGPEMDLEQTGYVLGVRYQRSFTETSPTSWWVRFGGIYEHLELEDSDGNQIDDSGHGFGLETGAGISVPMAERWSLTPGVRYRKLSRDLQVDGMEVPVKMESLAFELGVQFRI
jgi:opacity protein-like surface antigen